MEIVQSLDVKRNKNKFNKSAIAGLIYLIACFMFVIVKILNVYGLLSFENPILNSLISASLVQILIIFAIPLLLFVLLSKQTFKQTFKDFAFKKIKPISILYCVIIGLGVSIVISYISTFFSSIISFLGAESIYQQEINVEEFSIAMFFVTVFASCMLPAFCEEFLHRGMILNTYSKYGVTFAIVISSVLFGLLHMNIFQCFYAFIVGLFFAYICVYTKSIIPSMIMHFMNNFLSTLWDFSYVNNWFGGGAYVWQSNIINNLGADIYYFVSLVLCIIALFIIVFFSYKLIRKERIDEILSNVPEDVKEKYEMVKQNSAFMLYVKKSFMPQTVQEFYYQELKHNAKRQNKTLLEYLENPNAKLNHVWYDNIFIYTAISLTAFYTLYSFIYLVV